MSKLECGDPASDFVLVREDGGSVTRADLAGRPFVLFFYPSDDSPTCTDEALSFSALVKQFADAGVRLIGVSADKPASHTRFRQKRGLTVELVSDETLAAIKAFGLWGEKTTFGRTYMGAERATFLIDGNGMIAATWRKVRVKNHALEVLEAARALAPTAAN